MSIKLLDCTLRDGGYINDWNFGKGVIESILKKLDSSSIEFIEVGFLRNCDYDIHKTLFNNYKELEAVLPKDKTNAKFVAMILHNMYDIEKLQEYKGGSVEHLRVTFHDYDIDEGLEYVSKVKNKGYKVFCNPINIMGYSDSEILDIINKVNKIKPYGFSIVDTFGSMNKKDLIRIYSLCDNNLDKEIVLGLHLHENLNSAFSLAQEFISIASIKRDHILDASLFGMGRVPGNLCIELVANYLNENYGYKYDIDYLLDAIDEHILKLKKVEEWGYSIAYALSAKYNLHRNYSEFLLKKGRLTSKQIGQILSQITKDKKTAFDKNYIEKLYIDYQNISIDDAKTKQTLKEILSQRKILCIASGKSINLYSEDINSYINEHNPIVISLNFDGGSLLPDYYFFTNKKRFAFFKDKINLNQCIYTSNITQDNLALDYLDLALSNGDFFDNCTLMFFKFLIKIDISSVYIAGFDGFTEDNLSYFDISLETNLSKKESLIENEKVKESLRDIKKKLAINFLTPSDYEK